MWQRKPTTPGRFYYAISTDAPQSSKRYVTKRLSDPSWSMRRQRRTSNLWRMCSVKLPASWRATTVDAAMWPSWSNGWPLPSGGRAEAKLVIVYRIANNLVDVTTSSLTAAPTRTRGNSQRYLQSFTRIEAYKHSFFQAPSNHGTNTHTTVS